MLGKHDHVTMIQGSSEMNLSIGYIHEMVPYIGIIGFCSIDHQNGNIVPFNSRYINIYIYIYGILMLMSAMFIHCFLGKIVR